MTETTSSAPLRQLRDAGRDDAWRAIMRVTDTSSRDQAKVAHALAAALLGDPGLADDILTTDRLYESNDWPVLTGRPQRKEEALTDTDDLNPRRAAAPVDPTDLDLNALRAADWDGDGPTQWRSDDSPHDNTRRAGFALQGVGAYAAKTRLAGDVDAREVIGDLLGDLRHLCDALGLDFAALDEDGREHYDAELRGD